MVVYVLVALAIVLFFSSYGNTGTIHGAFKEALSLVNNTVHGRHLRANFWDITALQVYVSLRLMVIAILFSIVFGAFFAFLRRRIQHRFLLQLFETVASALEVVPEAVYVILIVVLLLFLLQFHIVLPAFPATNPGWKDTWVPAFALSLPGAFFLQRVLYLQLRDESSSDYILTAISKGSSERRSFYRHVVPNVIPVLFRQLPVIAGFILSSAIFTEFFMEYTGFLFVFINWATGWDYGTGIPLNGSTKPRGIPQYQPGLVFVIGAGLVVLWILVRISSQLFLKMFPAAEVGTTAPKALRHRFHKPALITGIIMLGAVVIVGLFPHLVTSQNPFMRLGNSMTYSIQSAKPPSRLHPFGTDDFGRDILAIGVHSVFQTLYPAVIATVLVVIISLVVSGIWFATDSRIIKWIIQVVGQSLSAIPALFILFLALYVTQLHSSHQLAHYLFWVVLVESGRGVYAYSETIRGWNQYKFLEGAVSVGRSNSSILVTHLRSWLGYFTLEFGFTEFARILSLMVQLAAFHLYPQERIGMLPFSAPQRGVVALHSTWLSMIGNTTANMLYIWRPYVLYVPVVFLVVVVGSVSLMAKGIRGAD